MLRSGTFVILAVIAAGCGGGAPKDMVVKDDLNAAESRLDQKIESSIVKLQQEFNEAKGKLPDILTAEARVSKALQEVGDLKTEVQGGMADMKKLVSSGRKEMLRVLEANERVLREQLDNIRELIEDLKKTIDD